MMIIIDRCTHALQEMSGRIIFLMILALIVYLSGGIPYINLFMAWFGLSFFIIMVLFVFKISDRIIILIAAAGIAVTSVAVLVRLTFIAEQMILIAFNLIIFSSIRLFFSKQNDQK